VWRTAVAVLACVLLVIVALLMLRFLAAAPR
jgi:hypothetical protein